MERFMKKEKDIFIDEKTKEAEILFIFRFEKIDEKTIENFQKKLLKPLPKDYALFLLEHNGGFCENNATYGYVEQTADSVKFLKGLNTLDKYYDLCENFELNNDLKEKLFKSIIIGETIKDRLICLSLLNGEVFLYNKETELIKKIADNFTEFYNNIVLGQKNSLLRKNYYHTQQQENIKKYSRLAIKKAEQEKEEKAKQWVNYNYRWY